MRWHIASWNVLAPIYMKCKYYATQTCSHLNIRSRRPTIHRTLQTIAADIFLLQEVTQTELTHLRRRFPHYVWLFQPHAPHYWKESPHHEPNGNVVGWRRTGLPWRVHEVTGLRLSRGNRALAVSGWFQQQYTTWISVHLDDQALDCRQQQVDRLLQTIDRRWRNSRVIVGGDFNEESSVLLATFRAHGFQVSPSRPTYFEEAPLALDYLMVREPLTHTRVSPFWYIPPSSRRDILQQFGSDHLPVIGVIEDQYVAL